MAVFKETLGKDFLEKYDGKEMMKIYAPGVAKLPNLAYRPYYGKPCSEIVQVCLKLGRCTQAEADALEKAFNEKFA